MPPKRSAKMVVKTTKKTVKETFEVSVVRRSKRHTQSGDDDDQEQLKTVSTETTEKANQMQHVEISVEKGPRSVPIGTEDGDEETEETPITPDQREVLKNDEQRSEEVKIQDGAKDREQEDSMETYVTADQKQDEQAEEDGEDEEESSKKEEPRTAVAKTREGEKIAEREDSMETNVTTDQPESEATKIDDGEKTAEREDSMETNVTTDQNEDEEEEPSKKDKPKSKEMKTRESKKSKAKHVSMDAETTSDKKTEEVSKVKSQGGAKKTENKRKRKRNTEGGEEYRRYVHKVLKQVHPGMGASFKAMAVLNNLMNDMFERLAGEAGKLTAYSDRKTLSSKEIQGAVKLVLPGELGRHAMAEGTKAVSAYVSSNEGGSKA